MKKLTITIMLIGILLIAGYVVARQKGLLGDKILSRVNFPTREISGEPAAIFFKNGSVMTCELLRKTEDKYFIKWKGEETVIFAEQVDHIGSPKEALAKKDILTDEEIIQCWPYENDIVIRLTNNVVVDAKINKVEEDMLSLLNLIEGGGRIEQDIERTRIDYLLFKPIDNQESKRIEEVLRKQFPQMEFYKEANFTIVTDSYITWVREYKKTLREAYTNIYLNFFKLLKDRKPQVQNFIVIFDDYVDFVEYAISDGVPGWAVAGYYSPQARTLYLFNVLGEKFSEILFEGMVGESGRTIDDIVDRIEGQVDERYHIFVEGQAKRIKDKFWRAYSYYRGIFREATTETLRHEFTHELLHNWGLQNINLSKFEQDNTELVEKKKEILNAKDCKKKAELAKSLIGLRSEPLDMKAANSWLVEGLATYCETDPIGAQNDMWLFIYQEMVREGPIYPLESLMQYKMGSFPGVFPKAALHLYAQSWALVTFLMEKYPEQFMAYQEKMTQKLAEGYEDVEWLQEALGKDLKTLEQEFIEYMDTYEKLEDPYLSNLVKLHNIFGE